ncbi:MAG: PIN domain-containing protein, partial [Deltaproteobacteria bacterium]|nr:PIN domain-containing protein [Deltaproteobacteria bacterium]
MKRRVLVDLNVILDVLLDRSPHADAAAALWAAIESGEAEGLLAAHCVTTLHYLASRSRGREFGDRCVADVLSVFAVAPLDAAVLSDAVARGWADFEDAVCAASATAAGCHLIATRDPGGFKGSPCP